MSLKIEVNSYMKLICMIIINVDSRNDVDVPHDDEKILYCLLFKVLKSGNIYTSLQRSAPNMYEILQTHRGDVTSFIGISHHHLIILHGTSEITYNKI